MTSHYEEKYCDKGRHLVWVSDCLTDKCKLVSHEHYLPPPIGTNFTPFLLISLHPLSTLSFSIYFLIVSDQPIPKQSVSITFVPLLSPSTVRTVSSPLSFPPLHPFVSGPGP